MFSRIFTPVDLGHLDALRRALDVAGDLSKHYGAPVTYASVTTHAPSRLARTQEEFERKLAAFVEGEISAKGHAGEPKPIFSHDPTADLEDALLDAAHAVKADLVVMASHVPNLADALWPSHGGTLASHADMSVILVR